MVCRLEVKDFASDDSAFMEEETRLLFRTSITFSHHINSINIYLGLIVMIIHVVQQGETINTIADMYKIETDRLIQENSLVNADNLAVGQTILVVYPKLVHTVKEGDTLQGIADKYGISLIQLLRNNPFLIDSEYIYPGETLVIQYEDDKVAKITTNGYVYPYIDLSILRKNLLYLTYLSVYSYIVTSNGDFDDIDDINIIDLAKSYGVEPVMVISNVLFTDTEHNEVAHNIIINQEIRTHFIENVLSTMKRKGYSAANINFPYIQSSDISNFIELITEFTDRLHKEGFKAFITLTPNTFVLDTGIRYEKADYSTLGQTVDMIVLSYYDWAYPINLSTQMIPLYYIKNLLEYLTLQIPPEKIILGGITIGYIWEIPYIEEVSKVSIISYTNAVVLASEENVPILFNKLNLSAYFYINEQNLSQVTFYDSRGFNIYTRLIPQFGLQGIGIWNVMYYLGQIFFLFNTQFDIENFYFDKSTIEQ